MRILLFSLFVIVLTSCQSSQGNKGNANIDAALTQLKYTPIANPKGSNEVSWFQAARRKSDQTYEIIFKAVIKDGWHIYSVSQDPKVTQPLTFTLTSNGATVEGAPTEQANVITTDDKILGGKIMAVHGPEAYFILTVNAQQNTAPVTGELEYMSCTDEKCLPPCTIEFTTDLHSL